MSTAPRNQRMELEGQAMYALLKGRAVAMMEEAQATHALKSEADAKLEKALEETSQNVILGTTPHAGRALVANFNNLPAVCSPHNAFGHLELRDLQACGADSTGNMLGHIFLTAMQAFQKNATFALAGCSEPNTVQSRLSNSGVWFQHNMSQDIPDLCQVCAGHYPHTCPNGLNHAAPLIQKVLRAVVPYPTDTTSLDDVAIHVRCGDVLKYAHHDEYGYPNYDFYQRILQDKNPQSIGIITAPWDKTRCRKNKDCDFVQTCKAIILDLKKYLLTTFPNARVQIHTNDTTLESYGRLMYAKQNVCNPSTFCVFPALAAVGDSFLVASPKLYPFVEKLQVPNIHIVEQDFLNMKDIAGFQKSGKDLADAITDWLRKPSPTSNLEPSLLQDDFLVLRNVCLLREPNNQETCQGASCPKYGLQFFGSSEDAVETFQKKASPYTAWASDLKNHTEAPLQGVPTAWTNATKMRDLLAIATNASFWDGTTVIAEPHHPDNNFHLHNDLILPVLYKMIKSGSIHLPAEHKRRLLLTHGSRQRYTNRVIAFDVLNALFDEVLYPLESILEEQYGGILCFERLIWGGRRTALPYYSHPGRFGEHDKWKGVVPQIRDWVNQVHSIEVNNNPGTTENPRLTWIDRPCAPGGHRCLHNVSGILHHLSSRFHVRTLEFERGKDRADQLKSMLWQMSNTDILVSMHGAGLGHAVYLQPRSILVEIKDIHYRGNPLFLNMANKQDIGYYLFDAAKAYLKEDPTLPTKTDACAKAKDSNVTIAGCNEQQQDGKGDYGVLLSELEMAGFAEDLWQAWGQEKDYQQLRKHAWHSSPSGECLFPKSLGGNQSILSSFGLSRCYLEQPYKDREWRQCVSYGACFSGGEDR